MQPGKGFRSSEFELVLACVRWPVELADTVRIQELVQQPIDWAHLLEITRQHQVAPLVSRNLEACAAGNVPPQPLAALRAAAMENARMCFQGISELVRLTRLFQEAQIDLRVLKGAPLAIAAFGDATLRCAGDIDLLIREADLHRADEILRGESYSRSEPAAWPTPRRMRSYIAHQKDFCYENYHSGMAIDLHWRLLRNPSLPVNARLEEAGLDWVQVGAERIPTLPLDRHFLYLCVHGALDGWLRLKWLADIGAILRGMSAERIRTIAQESAARSALPEFSAAVLLCQQRLGCDRMPAESLGPRDPTVARILRLANRLMASNDYCPVRERIPTTTWFKNEFFLAPTLTSRIELVERSLFKPRVWRKLSLPDALFPLYALISPFEWLQFRARRLSGWLLRRLHWLPSGSGWKSHRGFSRFFRLSLGDAALLMEAASMLTLFRVALKFFSVQRLTSWMVHPHAAGLTLPDESENHAMRRIEWAIGAVVRHAPLTYVCFPQSLAAYFMLRRRHIRSRLFYGVAREEQQLKAHTWIKVGDRTVVGGEAESRFTILAIFP